MKTIIKVLKALFILTLIINSLEVYGYGLRYVANYGVEGSPTQFDLRITNMTEASQGTISEYGSNTRMDISSSR